MRSGTNAVPAARKKPELVEPVVAAPGVDVRAVTCFMAEELLHRMEGYPNGGSAHRSDFVVGQRQPPGSVQALNPKPKTTES